MRQSCHRKTHVLERIRTWQRKHGQSTWGLHRPSGPNSHGHTSSAEPMGLVGPGSRTPAAAARIPHTAQLPWASACACRSGCVPRPLAAALGRWSRVLQHAGCQEQRWALMLDACPGEAGAQRGRTLLVVLPVVALWRCLCVLPRDRALPQFQ